MFTAFDVRVYLESIAGQPIGDPNVFANNTRYMTSQYLCQTFHLINGSENYRLF